MPTKLNVLAVASEVYPLIKTGGLADVAGALPGALKAEGVAVRTLLPGYPAVMKRLKRAKALHAFATHFGGPARLLGAKVDGLDLIVLDAPHLFDRAGGPYAGLDGRDFGDNAIRFAALSAAGAAIAQGLLADWRPDVVHAHDWQAGMTAAYLTFNGGPRTPLVFTVHNLAFQGQFSRATFSALGLPAHAFTHDGVEYYGDIGFLKAGLRLADRVTTVSPTYAAEICTPDWGMGLDGLIRGRADRLSGILNGIDTDVWNPATDPLIAQTYDATDLTARAANKAALQAQLGLEIAPDAPLFGVVSRLSWQKGLDLLLAALPTILETGGQLAVLGSGEPWMEDGFTKAAAWHAGRIGVQIGYDEGLAHAIQAGVDALIVPSRFEPCGLTQLCALRYGAVPVVARVGGLADTVIDAGPMAMAARTATGVQFSPVNGPMLESAIRRAATHYRNRDAWRRLQLNGMGSDVSWTEPARAYANLYRDLAG
jgi:starch synthase